MADERSQASEPTDLSESVAGEEDPGASLDMPAGSARRPEVSAMDGPAAAQRSPGASDQPAGEQGARPGAPSAPMAPGDEAPAGTPGTGEDLCRACGGSGQLNGGACPECEGTGKVTVGIGGA